MLKQSIGMAIVVSAVWAAQAASQEGPATSSAPSDPVSGLTPTPEMWYYQQERERYEDPQQTVRRKAEFRGQQRRMRVAVRKWYGYSPERPLVSATPWGAAYRQGWPYQRSRTLTRVGSSRPTVIITPSEY